MVCVVNLLTYQCLIVQKSIDEWIQAKGERKVDWDAARLHRQKKYPYHAIVLDPTDEEDNEEEEDKPKDPFKEHKRTAMNFPSQPCRFTHPDTLKYFPQAQTYKPKPVLLSQALSSICSSTTSVVFERRWLS